VKGILLLPFTLDPPTDKSPLEGPATDKSPLEGQPHDELQTHTKGEKERREGGKEGGRSGPFVLTEIHTLYFFPKAPSSPLTLNPTTDRSPPKKAIAR
jgi:hypothetical protein